MLPPFLLLNYNPILPWYLAPLLWMIGVAFLWATRYTFRMYPKFGNNYYLASAILRPLGILLIGWGWMEVLGQKLPLGKNQYWAWLTIPTLFVLGLILAIMWRRWFLIIVFFIFIACSYFFYLSYAQWTLSLIGFGGAFLFGTWAILKLGLRQSFLYRKIDDPLITEGPYAWVRHPQLSSAIFMVWFSCFWFSRNTEWKTWIMDIYSLINALLFSLLIWLVIRVEERDLKQELEEAYESFAQKTPRLLPNLWRQRSYTHCKTCQSAVEGKLKRCPQCQSNNHLQTHARPRTAYGCILLLIVPSIALSLAFLKLDGWAWSEGGRLQSEAKTNLGAIYVAQLSYFAEHNTYAGTGYVHNRRLDAFDLLDLKWFSLNRNNSYSYCIGKESFLPSRDYDSENELKTFQEEVLKICDQFSGVSKTGFTALAVGNIDNDPDLDVWTINDAKILINMYNDQ